MRWAVALCMVVALTGTASAGGTFELGFGGGAVTTRADGKNATAAAGSSPTIGAGARIGPSLWVLGRVSLLIAKQDRTFTFFGGSLQYFPTDRFFVAGGLGYVEQSFEKMPGTNISGYGGFAFDARAGVNLFPEYRHTILLQLELTPTIYRDSQSLSAMLLASYQYL